MIFNYPTFLDVSPFSTYQLSILIGSYEGFFVSLSSTTTKPSPFIMLKLIFLVCIPMFSLAKNLEPLNYKPPSKVISWTLDMICFFLLHTYILLFYVCTGGPWATWFWAMRFWAAPIFGKKQRVFYYKSPQAMWFWDRAAQNHHIRAGIFGVHSYEWRVN